MVIFCPKMRPDNSKVMVARLNILFTLYDAEFGDLRGEDLKNEVSNYCWCGAHYGAIVAILAVAVMFTLSGLGGRKYGLAVFFNIRKNKPRCLAKAEADAEMCSVNQLVIVTWGNDVGSGRRGSVRACGVRGRTQT
jgi:hypothetical protein